MTPDTNRRRMMQLSLLAAASGLMPFGKALGAAAAQTGGGAAAEPGSTRDFDFFLGAWQVRHRRLKKRLANNHEWEEFDGVCRVQSLLGGLGNIGDSLTHRPGGSTRGIGLRAFDPDTRTWADWWLGAGTPHRIDPPGIGRFVDGVGTFLSDDHFEGRPIKVRGVFSHITPDSLQWEQAFSPDGGEHWESNWVMRYTRTA